MKKFMLEMTLGVLLLTVAGEKKKTGEKKNRWIQKKADNSRIWNFRISRI